MRSVLVPVLVLVFAACAVDANHDGTVYRCSDGRCPSGRSCVQGMCVLSAPPGGDAETAPPADAGSEDVADAAPAPCLGGTARLTDPTTGRCYVYFATPATFAAAETMCMSALGQAARLTAITSVRENTLVAALPGAGVAEVWAGGSDAKLEMTFAWTSGEAFQYTNWRVGEPNNDGVNGEDCLVVEVDTAGSWDDRNCELSYPYVCERP